MKDPSEFYHAELDKLRGELPEAIANLELLKEKKKAILALEMRVAESKGHKSVAAQEREAYASAQYDTWLGDYFRAVVKAEGLRMAYKGLQTRTDIWRTNQSTKRAEMNIL